MIIFPKQTFTIIPVRRTIMAPYPYSAGMIDPIPSVDDCERMEAEAAGRTNAKIRVFYNDECPICNAEICHYKRQDQESAEIDFVPISERPDALIPKGLNKDQVKRRLYAYRQDGTLLSGVDSFITIWQTLPRYRWLAKLTKFPGIYQIAHILYEYGAVPLLAWWNRVRPK